VLGVGDDEASARQRPDERSELAPVDAAKALVEAAPAGDAVDVGSHLGLRQGAQIVEGEAKLALDGAEDAQVPGRQVDVWHGARVQDGPLLREVLAWRQPCRVVPRVEGLALGFRAEHRCVD